MSPKYLPRENPELYEINTAAWLYELSHRLRKRIMLGNVPAGEWDRLKELGMDFVWLMGVWARSQEGRKISLNSPEFRRYFETVLPGCTPEDIIGSCYSISAYSPDPLVGTWEDLARAYEELHKRGMGLILDFVPNHTGIDHHWLHEHPEYFIQGNEKDYRNNRGAFFPVKYNGKLLYIAHGRDPNFPPWTDTAQLNYCNPAARQAMVGVLETISRYCDGIRCDMAMLVLNDIFQQTWGRDNRNPGYPVPREEFWGQAVRQVPNLVYMAEAYWDTEWTLQQLGFDFVYDKRLYDRMRAGHPHDVYLHLTAEMDYQRKLIRFIENHDELRSVTAFGKNKTRAAAALFSTLPGLKLFFHGQIEGKQIRLPVQLRQSKPETVDPEIQAFYEKLLPVINEEIFHAGVWKLKPVFDNCDNTAANLIASTWKLGDSIKLVIVNLSQHPSQGRVCFQDDVSESHEYLLTDNLSGQSMTRSGILMAHPGMGFNLSGYQAQIFDISQIK